MHMDPYDKAAKAGVRKGAWTEEEDNLLRKCIQEFGEGKWHQVPTKSGLNRCRKSCRLRWLNYLRPDIKRGDFAWDEVDLIMRLHKLLGNRWSLIRGRLPGRTANDVKNYWNTHLKERDNLGIMLPRQRENGKRNVVIRPRPRNLSKISSHTSMGIKATSSTRINISDNDMKKLSFTSPSTGVLQDNVTQWWENLLSIGDCEEETTTWSSFRSFDKGVKAVAETDTSSRMMGDNSTSIDDGEFGWSDFQFPIGMGQWNF